MSTRARLALGVVACLGLGWLALRLADRGPQQPAVDSSSPAVASGPGSMRSPPGDAPVRPTRPPVRGIDEPPVADEPTLPIDADALRLAAYQAALEEQDPRPGEQAFRAMVTAFVEHNHRFAQAQAQAEGLGLDEVEELTFLGLMAQESQRWSEVEQVLGGPVDAETRRSAEAMLTELDADFKQSMRDLVADGASAEDRWALIRSFESDYRERYFGLTGMDEDTLDDLLAGDASRDYAPGSTPPPEDMPPREDGPTPIEPREAEPAPPR